MPFRSSPSLFPVALPSQVSLGCVHLGPWRLLGACDGPFELGHVANPLTARAV